jgi:hypothetical protein
MAAALAKELGRAVQMISPFEEAPDHSNESTSLFRCRLHVHGKFVDSDHEAE